MNPSRILMLHANIGHCLHQRRAKGGDISQQHADVTR